MVSNRFPGSASRAGGEVNLDEVGDENSRDVSAIGSDGWAAAAKDERVDQASEFGIEGVFVEQRGIF